MSHFAKTSLATLRTIWPKVIVQNGSMIDLGSRMFPQTNEHHLHQAALDVTHEASVRFHATTDDHMIRFPGVAIESAPGIPRPPRRQRPSPCWRLDRAPTIGLRDPVILEDLSLPFSRSPTMTSHGGHNKWISSQLLNMLHDGPDDLVNP
jgi:hypothetical protein